MSALADSAAQKTLPAVVTLVTLGAPIMARCPVCDLEYGVRTVGTVRFLAWHGPRERRCMGGGASLTLT
jgi:hypothetical protein